MDVGIVAYEMEGASTGVGSYLEGLLGGLAEQDATHTWHLFFQGDPFDHPLWRQHPERFRPIFDGRRGHPIFWEQLRLPRLLRQHSLDLVFSPAYSLPPGLRVPSMVAIHDLSFERLPQEFGFKERQRRRFLARRAAQRADRVLAPLERVARELGQTYGVAKERLGVVPIGIEVRSAPPPARAQKLRDELGVRSPYLLFLGSLLPRRRIDLVVAAFAELALEHPDLQLVLAGGNRLRRPADLDRWIATSGVEERILRPGYVPRQALVPLYAGALASFYLSTYEGWGLPPLESLLAGTPAVVSGELALDEIWPEYPYRCQELTAAAVTEVTRKVLVESRQDVAQEATEQIAPFTWKRSAELFSTEMERAVGAS